MYRKNPIYILQIGMTKNIILECYYMKYILDGKEMSLEELNNAINNTILTDSYEEVITIVEIKNNTMILETSCITFY